MIEMYTEKIPVTVSLADGTEDTSPVVHHGARILEDGVELMHLAAADNYGLTRDQVESAARKVQRGLGINEASKTTTVASIQRAITQAEARLSGLRELLNAARRRPEAS